MKNIEFTRIESVRGAMPAGIGGIVRYSIEMISYFSADTDNGQQFIGLLTKRVRQYENRIRDEK
jgi:hypothetical protein